MAKWSTKSHGGYVVFEYNGENTVQVFSIDDAGNRDPVASTAFSTTKPYADRGEFVRHCRSWLAEAQEV